MTDSQRKKIEKALTYVKRNKTAYRKRFFLRNFLLKREFLASLFVRDFYDFLHKREFLASLFVRDFYDKAAKRLCASMFKPITEYFNTAADCDKDILITLLHRIHKFYTLESVPLFFINVILNGSLKMEIRKTAACMLPLCFANVPLDNIEKLYGIKEFRFEAVRCLPFCEDDKRHTFAIEVLKEQPNPQITETAVHSLFAEKITIEDAALLQTLYSQSKNPHLRYYIMELLYKSPAEGLSGFFAAAYKKERLITNRLQAIIGIYIKDSIETADKTIEQFVGGILKRKNMDERTLGDLRAMADWLSRLKEIYPSRGFKFAYEAISSMEGLKVKKN
jgi:hypothetical protein